MNTSGRQKRISHLTEKELREILDYDPKEGTFKWKVCRTNNVPAGSIAGCLNAEGYRRIRINGRHCRAARLAWLYMTGEWPEEEVDHINSDPSDDRWANLRACSRRQNIGNRRPMKSNKTGCPGVRLVRGRWVAKIRVDGEFVELSKHEDFASAADAYYRASVRIYGEFARDNRPLLIGEHQ